MNTSNFTEQTKNQGDVAMRKKVKKEKTGSRNSSIDDVNSGYGPDYQTCIPLGWAP
jgi:hypothetical protein